MSHPDLHSSTPADPPAVGEHPPRKVTQDFGPPPVRRGVESGQLNLACQPQSLRRHHARHLAVTRHHRIPRRDAGVRDHRVVSALGLQRHVIARRGASTCDLAPAAITARSAAISPASVSTASRRAPSMRKPSALARRSSAPCRHAHDAPAPLHRRQDRDTDRSLPPARRRCSAGSALARAVAIHRPTAPASARHSPAAAATPSPLRRTRRGSGTRSASPAARSARPTPASSARRRCSSGAFNNSGRSARAVVATRASVAPARRKRVSHGSSRGR